MRLTGFGAYNWEADGYWAGIPEDWMPVVAVEPQILNRPGAYATFGLSVIGSMLIPAQFGYSGALEPEAAFLNLFKRLNPVDITPRQLRAIRNDGTAISIPAQLQIPQFSNTAEVNVKNLNFVAVRPWWEATGYTTGTGGFS